MTVPMDDHTPHFGGLRADLAIHCASSQKATSVALALRRAFGNAVTVRVRGDKRSLVYVLGLDRDTAFRTLTAYERFGCVFQQSGGVA
jgi:hypothetical protein